MTRRTSRFRFDWKRTKPRTAAEKRARRLCGAVFNMLRKEIRNKGNAS